MANVLFYYISRKLRNVLHMQIIVHDYQILFCTSIFYGIVDVFSYTMNPSKAKQCRLCYLVLYLTKYKSLFCDFQAAKYSFIHFNIKYGLGVSIGNINLFVHFYDRYVFGFKTHYIYSFIFKPN